MAKSKGMIVSNKLRSTLLHVAVWLFLAIVITGISTTLFGVQFAILKISFAFTLIATVFYLNYHWLIPSYFYEKKYFVYVLLSAFLIIGISFLRFEIEEQLLSRFVDIPHSRFTYLTFTRYLLSTSAVFGLAFLFKLANSWIKVESKKHELQALEYATEIKMLKNQLQPHFLFNSINNIYSLAVEKDERIPDLLLEISDLLRYLIYKSTSDKITLAEEVHFLNSLIRLYSLRYENVPFNEVEVDGDITKVQIAPLLLLPFIENVFKHSDFEKTNEKWTLHLSVKEDGVTFEVENPIAEKERQTEKPSGIGIENVRQRLNLLYPQKHNLTIKNDGNYYSAKLTILTNE